MEKNEKLPTPEFVYKSRSRVLSDEETITEIYNMAGIKKGDYPINMWEVAKSFNFDIYEASFNTGPVSGVMFDYEKEIKITPDISSKRAIILDKSDVKKIQSFTIAHELAHFMLHMTDGDGSYQRIHVSRKENPSSEENLMVKYREDAADSFAAKLLMPQETFLELVARSPNRDDEKKLTNELSDAFMAGEIAINKRFKELNVRFG